MLADICNITVLLSFSLFCDKISRVIMKKGVVSLISGEKLKKLRLMRTLTQKELATKSGLTDAAIRNYELGNRSPSKEQLQKISETLDCDISALINHEPNSIFEIMHIIFDYEKDIKFRPSADTGEITGLLSNDVDFNNFLIEWN